MLLQIPKLGFDPVLLYTILTLMTLGGVSAVILYFVAKKFNVEENPLIDDIEAMLPGVNCGGCGFAGCRALADALVMREDISGLYCPVGGAASMSQIANYLDKAAPQKDQQVAVVRCRGGCEHRPKINTFDGAPSCAVMSSLYAGESACSYGCLGRGDCVEVCQFGALSMDTQSGLPRVDPAQCTACGACQRVCPKSLIKMHPIGKDGLRVYVACLSQDKGAVARKGCKVACIGCGKCVKVCDPHAIALKNNLAYIDPGVCQLCMKCVGECPTGAIYTTTDRIIPVA